MTTKRLFTTICSLALTLSMAWAQGPNGSEYYYKDADGKKGAALKTALCGIIYNKTERDYDDLWTDFRSTDKRPTDGKVWDMYSGITNYTFGTDQAGNYSAEGDKYNREHSFPKSWFGISGSNIPKGPGTDLFHLYPTDGYVNGMRSNYPFGETSSPTYSSVGGFSKLGPCSYPGYTGKVFEPNDLYKGDFARTYFYMVTCYENLIETWYEKNSESHPTLDGKKYPGLSSWQLSMLMKWAKNDEVSAKERARNIAVAGIQNNRNPFIDYPGLEEYIWGEWQDVEFSYDNYVSPYEGETPTTVSTPTFSPAGGTYKTAQTVTISCATSGATIYYTTDGTTPSASSTKYNAAIKISETTTLKAIAVKDGTESSVAEATYTINTGGGEPVSVEYEATFNFPENNYGMKELSSSSSSSEYNPNPTTITSDGVSLTMAGDNSSRYWMNTNGTYELRVYKACTMTISAPDNGKITKIVFAGSTISSILNNGKSLSNGTWTGKENSVVFTFNANQRINTITITYEDESAEPTTTPGDIVKDGKIDWNDLKALVKILLGITPAGENIDSDAADVNSDDETNIADVTKLVNKILQTNK